MTTSERNVLLHVDDVSKNFEKTDTAIDLPIRLLTQSEFARQQSRDGLRLGLFYGAMLIMVLFNLFLFIISLFLLL